MAAAALLAAITVALFVGLSNAHGWLVQPAGRSSAWRYGFSTPANYNDNSLNCGGFGVQFGIYGGKCGLCGDPYGGPRQNEPGPNNMYATGTIVANYTQGQTIAVRIQITASHMGYHEFRLCINDVQQSGKDSTMAARCDPLGTSFPLLASPDGRTRFDEMEPVIVLQLPLGVTCDACILQWRWKSGNSWGCDDDGCGLGHGNQEEFYGCADIKIIGRGGSPTTPKPTAIAPSTSKPDNEIQPISTAATVTHTASTREISARATTSPPSTLSRSTSSSRSISHAPLDESSRRSTVISSQAKATTVNIAASGGRVVCEAAADYGNDIKRWCNLVCNWAEHPFCPSNMCNCVRV